MLHNEAFTRPETDERVTLALDKTRKRRQPIKPRWFLVASLPCRLDLLFAPHAARRWRFWQVRWGLVHRQAASHAIAPLAPGSGVLHEIVAPLRQTIGAGLLVLRSLCRGKRPQC